MQAWGVAVGLFLLGSALLQPCQPKVLDQHTCRSRSSSSSSSWVAFFCILSRAAWRDAGTSLQAVSGCREETELLGERREGTDSLGSIVGTLAPGRMGVSVATRATRCWCRLPESQVVVEHGQQVGDVVLGNSPVLLVLLPTLNQGFPQAATQRGSRDRQAEPQVSHHSHLAPWDLPQPSQLTWLLSAPATRLESDRSLGRVGQWDPFWIPLGGLSRQAFGAAGPES